MTKQLLQIEAPCLPAVDVLVCGGGPAGTASAIAAARNGADTLLVEQQGCLGGVGTGALVGTWVGGYSRDGAYPVVGGIYAELVDRLATEGAAIPASDDVISGTRHLGYASWHGRVTPFDFEACKRVSEQMATDAGVHLRYFSSVVRPRVERNRITGVFLHSKNGIEYVPAAVVIDATGDGDVAARAGCECFKGRPEDGLMSAPSVFPVLEDVDAAAFKTYCDETGDVRLRNIIARLKAQGEWPFDFEILVCCELTRPDRFFINACQQQGVDGTNADDLTRAMIQGRRDCKRLADLMRKHVPGFASARLVETSHIPGVRETRRIIGRHTITVDEVRSGTAYPDTIALSGYQWDMADPKHLSRQSMKGVVIEKAHTEIPYRAMLPVGIDNLLVAGRCISTEWHAMGVVRIMPACYAMGHAAGIAAAMAAQKRLPVTNVPPDALRAQLQTEQAIL